MRIATKVSSLIVLLALLTGSFSVVPAAPSAPWQSKVDPWVIETASMGETEFIVFLSEQADLSGAASLKTKLEKGTYVFQRLTEVANRTQPAVIAALKTHGVQFKPYWVANMLWVRGDLSLILACSSLLLLSGLGIGLFAVVTWEGFGNALEGWEKNLASDVLRIPAWPFLLFVPAGAGQLVLVLLCQLFEFLGGATREIQARKI